MPGTRLVGTTQFMCIIYHDLLIDVGLAVSFEEESYTVIESDGYVEVCFLTNSGHTEPIEVEILPIEKAEVPVVNRAISQ